MAFSDLCSKTQNNQKRIQNQETQAELRTRVEVEEMVKGQPSGLSVGWRTYVRGWLLTPVSVFPFFLSHRSLADFIPPLNKRLHLPASFAAR